MWGGGGGCLNFIRIKSYSFSKVYLEFYGHEQDKFCAICSKKFFVSNCILHETIVYVYWSSYFDNNLTWEALCNLFKEVWEDLKWFTGGYIGLKWKLQGNPKFWMHQMTVLKDKMYCFANCMYYYQMCHFNTPCLCNELFQSVPLCFISSSSCNLFITTSCHFKSCSSPVPHVDEGEGGVQGGHEDVGEGEVEQEVVRHTPHSPMGTHCPEHLGQLSYRVFF